MSSELMKEDLAAWGTTFRWKRVIYIMALISLTLIDILPISYLINTQLYLQHTSNKTLTFIIMNGNIILKTKRGLICRLI